MDEQATEALREAVLARAQAGDVAGAAQGWQAATPASTPLNQALGVALQAVVAIQQGHVQDSLQRLVPCLHELEHSALAPRLDWVYTGLAYALGMLGDAERGLGWAARALALTEDAPRSPGRRKALGTQGTLLAMLEQFEPARVALQACLELAEEQADPRGVVVALVNLAYACVDEGWHRDEAEQAERRGVLARLAMAYAERALPLALQAGLQAHAGFACSSLGFGLLELGRVEEALPVFERAEALTAAHPSMHAEALFGTAVALRRLGRLDEAREHLQQAEQLATQAQLPHVRGRILDEGVHLEQAAGQAEAALDWARQGVRHWKRQLAQRVQLLTRSASLFEELERSRREADGLRDRARAWEDAALHDPLTGALNRLGLQQASVPLWGQREAPLALLLVDVDHFKQVNDQHGHPVGDAVLRQLVQVLGAQLRQGDLLARLGGEEFVLLLPGAEGPAALAIAERLRQAVMAQDWAALAPGLAPVRVSVGLAQRAPGEDFSALSSRADAALYQAKQQGRNRVVRAP
ncbi:GGDEF domain-containing protein [Inhella proteolytica]|uniref:diguanylate cyclase n=1 Tax=Inhella proteolytica TaxID=2795029 RepID=A0A931J5Z4_9BURK|nr:diguanylate cyclase [Inhella proteolytica]MBH9578443.1 diguanylate cyclase [Inhella proteolytica]